MMDLTDSVVAALKADASITSLATGGVFWVRPPGEGRYDKPFLTVIEHENMPIDYADDEEIETLINVMVEIYSPKKFASLKTAVNNRMSALGFRRTSVGADGYIQELKLYTKAMIYTIQKGVQA
jgi:hypothetical protein